jgi:hypothetical protein
MRKVSIGRVLAVLALALLFAGPAHAQGIVFAGGWAPQWVDAQGTSEFVPLGLFVNVAGTVAPNVQIVGDLGWGRKNGDNLTTFTGGVRYLIPQSGGKATPFIEGLVGGGNITGGGTGFAFGVGGGVDVKAMDQVNVRFQVNYFMTRVSGVNINEVRFGIGISGSTSTK